MLLRYQELTPPFVADRPTEVLGVIGNFPYWSLIEDIYERDSNFLRQLINEKNYVPSQLTEYTNLFTVVRDSEMDSEAIRQVLLNPPPHEFDGSYSVFTESQVNALIAQDEEWVLREFANEFCIIKGVNYYSPAWFHYNDIEAYEEAELTAEEIFELLKISREFPLFYSDYIELKLCQYALKTGSTLTVEDICGYERDIDMPQPYYNQYDYHSRVGGYYVSDLRLFDYWSFKGAFKSISSPSRFNAFLKEPDDHDYREHFVIGENTKLNFDVSDRELIEELASLENGEYREALLTQDAEKILKQFTKDNDTVLVKGDSFYTFAWVYYNKPSAYAQAGITPEELLEMLPKYRALGILRDEAMTALENKVFEYAAVKAS